MTAFAPRFTITNAITAGLTAIERARGFLEAATLSEEWVRRMSQRALLLEAHHTTHIEGTQLTIEQAERLWAGKTVDEAEPDDVRELLNYREAFNFVSEYLESGEPITEGLIREIHKRLVEGVRGGQGGPGAYRKIQNYVANSRTREIIYTPPSPEDVPPLMQELVSWLRDESGIHPVLMAGIAQFQRCTFILSSTVTDALRGCCRRWFSTARVMISSGCLRSVNFMTATGALFTWRFRVCASRAWI